ncbi:MAG: M48 family metalloprotease [Bacteroidetes bacterium]|nr:M48 family metalloprotease [Bacteroidota bacterium]
MIYKVLKNTCLFFLIFNAQALFSQQLTPLNYSPLLSKGNLPEIYSKKIKITPSDLALNKRGETDKKDNINFLRINNIFITRLFNSGIILYNDTVSAYLNQVAEQIFKLTPDLHDQLKIYLIRSKEANAYCLNNGCILVTTGLIAQAENEAELAYIICHEIIHYQKKHVYNEYVSTQTLEKEKQLSTTAITVLLEQNKYSRENETEADGEGLELFKKTNYGIKNAAKAMDVLLYSRIPFEDFVFNKSFFEDSYFKFPDNYFLKKDEINPVKSPEDYDDKWSTHPNIKTRRLNILKSITNYPSDNHGKSFLISESGFYYVRDICRIETTNIYIHDLDYGNAIYAAYILLKKYPDNFYIKKMLAISLYNFSAHKVKKENPLITNDDYSNEFLTSSSFHLKDYKKIEGQSEQVFYFLSKLSGQESSVLALSYSWKLYNQNNYKDSALHLITEKLFTILAKEYHISYSQFSSLPYIKNTTSDSTVNSSGEISKYEKFRKKKMAMATMLNLCFTCCAMKSKIQILLPVSTE